MSLPHIPFAQLPRREYKKGPVSIGGELKPRLDLDKFFNGEEEVEEFDDADYESESDESSADSGYDLMKHVASLLPGELEDGKKPQKEADTTHLQDLKVVKKRPDRLKYVKQAYTWVMTMRARERERRKHYILREYERRIREFDELQKKVREDAINEEERLIRQEAKERQQRIERNSRKKKNKLLLTKDFDDKIAQRVRDNEKINFYCDKLPEWAIEGMYKKFAEKEAAVVAKQAAEALVIEAQKEAEKQAIIARDRAILEEDQRITEDIETMMIRYGMLHFDKPLLDLEDEKLDHIFEQHRLDKLANTDADSESVRQKKRMRKQARAERAARRQKKTSMTSAALPSLTTSLSQAALASRNGSSGGGGGRSSRPGTSTVSRPSTAASQLSGVGETTLDLEVAPTADLQRLRRDLHRSRFGGTGGGGGGGGKGKGHSGVAHRHVDDPVVAFPGVDFQDTSDIRIVYGHHLRTLGALALASEMSQGACPFLEEFRLQNCDIRDDGFLRLIQGVRLGNVTSLRVLDLRGNHLTALSVDYYRDLCGYGIFNQMEELLLGNNNLGDDGVEAIIRVMLLGHLRSLIALHLQRNGITDKGFRALMTMLTNVHDRYCPQLDAVRLELNLVTPECKHSFAPMPSYVAV